jgi:hypothetical protein
MTNIIESQELSLEEVRHEAEALAQSELGVSLSEALVQMERGQLRGTVLESKLSMFRFLLADNDSTPLAAE